MEFDGMRGVFRRRKAYAGRTPGSFRCWPIRNPGNELIFFESGEAFDPHFVYGDAPSLMHS